MARRYELKERAQRQADTRRRILDATVDLHLEHGPAATQVSDIAKRAGVDRVTVYRHFPDTSSLLQACAAHYYGAHPLPDPRTWEVIDDPEARLRRGLTELYRYWAENAAMVTAVLRDAQVLGHLGVGRRLHALQADATDVLATGWSTSMRSRAGVAATIRVAVDFHTWERLVREERLTEHAAVGLAVDWTRCVSSTP